MRAASLGIGILVFLAALGALWYYSGHVPGSSGRSGGIACTMEALMCPDGSGVGRTGAACRFSACPEMPQITGELQRDASGFRLMTQASTTAPGATYVMPLLIATSTAQPYLNQRVSVSGTFTEGNMLRVTSIMAAPEGSDPHEAVVGVGETKLIDGVQVTLNRVVQDSRCPVDAQCIEAGAITASVTLKSDTDRETIDMPSDQVPHAFDAFQVSIVNVAPDRHSGVEPAPASYRVTFRVDPL